jgi:hypothetical protein
LGQIIGSSTIRSPGTYLDNRAVLWLNETIFDLGILGVYGPWSSAIALNNAGYAVGSNNSRATLWRPGTSVEQIQALANRVSQLEVDGTLTHNQAKTLNSYLVAAADFVERGKTKPAISELQDFVDYVSTLMSGRRPHLSAAIGQPLIDLANATILRLEG